MTIALLDGDIYCWRAAASCEPNQVKQERESLDDAIYRLDTMLYDTLSATAADEHRIFLSGGENFRYLIYQDYKANRRNVPRPAWLDPCREFLVREWGAEITNGYEADDGIGISHTENAVICSIDKDLRQIPGQHYNFVTKTFDTVDSREAALSFWMAVITGDRSDNIPGVRGMGPVKAKRALSALSSEEMEQCVRSLYADEQQFLLNFRLLRILRSHEEYFNVIEEIHAGKYDLTKTDETEITPELYSGLSEISN
jgi:5'-3' exonuclease